MSANDFAELDRWYRDGAHQYASILRWHRTVGYARHDGVGVDMREPCALAGEDIEYLPGRYTIDGREMTADERDCVGRLLAQMAHDARDALAGQSTLVVVQDRARAP